MLDMAKPRQWVRPIYQSTGPIRAKNLTLKVPLNSPGRVIISKRGVSVAPLGQQGRGTVLATPTPKPQSKAAQTAYRRLRGPNEENRKRNNELKVFTHGFS